MWPLTPLSACLLPTGTTPGSTTSSVFTAPTASSGVLPLGPDLPTGDLAMAVEPLVQGISVPMRADGALAGATVRFWSGTFGGKTCPAALGGSCVPIGGASEVAVEVADAIGSVATTYAVPVTALEGDYPVLVATSDGVRSLPVMRRVWVGTPDYTETDLLDPWDLDWDFFGDPDPVPELPAGDWMDLSVEYSDDFLLPAAGNTIVRVDAHFHRGLMDVDLWMRPPEGPSDAFIWFDHDDWSSDPTPWFEGQSLITGSWTFSASVQYMSPRGLYDLHVRHGEPATDYTFFEDADEDSWGDPASPTDARTAPDGTTWRADDCDDSDPDVSPDAWDICGDGFDDDCSGMDKPCHGAPDHDGPIAEFAGLHVQLTDGGNPYDVAAIGDVDLDGVAEIWLRDRGERWEIEASPGPEMAPPLVTDVDGWGASRGGDFDHDGVRDVAYGGDELEVTGAVLLVRTPMDLQSVTASPWATLLGDEAGKRLSTGDLDGDGFDDLVVQGEAVLWVVSSVGAGTADLDIVATAKVMGSGIDALDSSADFDGDGLSDIAVVTPNDEAFLLLSPLAGALDIDLDADGLVQLGVDGHGELSTGDTDGDGFDELVASGGDQVWLFESPVGVSTPVDAATVVNLGLSNGVAVLADIDGDGFDDLFVEDRIETGSDGQVVLNYGPLPASIDLPTDADVVLTPPEGIWGSAAQSLWQGDYDGDGGDDVAIVSYEHSVDILFGLP